MIKYTRFRIKVNHFANSWRDLFTATVLDLFFYQWKKSTMINEALNEIPFSVCLIKFSVLFIHAPRYLFRLTLGSASTDARSFFDPFDPSTPPELRFYIAEI